MVDTENKRDVVLLYAPPWESPTRFSKHHLATFFADRGHRVLYVEAPLSPFGLRHGKDFLRELRRSMWPPRRARDSVWVTRPFVPLPYHAATRMTSTRVANRVGQRFAGARVRTQLAHLRFSDPLLIAGLPHAVDALPQLRWSTLVYHCADDYASVRGFPRTFPQLEAELSRRADIVVTTSETLCEKLHGYNGRTYWIPNGADVEHFSEPVEIHPELRGIKRPIVGFVGGLSQWIDIPLIARLASTHPEWSFVLIGPAGVDVDGLPSMQNVHLLGARPYSLLPRYLAGMDVALIPFRQEPVTYYADPIKAYEYLAAGVPVVATELPALRRLQHVLALASSPAEFADRISDALQAGRGAGLVERQHEAARHSWTSRFEQFERFVQCAS